MTFCIYTRYNPAGGGDGSQANPYGLLSDALASAGTTELIVITGTPYQLGANDLNLYGGQYAGARIRRAGNYNGVLFSVSATATVSGVTVDGNRAQVTGSTGSLFSVTSGGALTVSDGALLQNNIATTGGGVSVTGGGSLTLNGGTISGNSAGASPASGNNGGGIYVSQGSVNLVTGRVAGNAAYQGGGIYATGATLANGNGVITGNRSVSSGGGIFFNSPPAQSDPNLSITAQGEISHNTAGSDNGGGIFLSGNNVNVEIFGAPKIIQNTGTGIYSSMASNAVITMTGGTISNNITSGSGAGVNIFAGGTFTLAEIAATPASISGNISLNGDGAGIFFSGGTALNLNSGTISGNTAQGNGGGVFGAGTVNLNGTNITGNRALGYGTVYSGQGGGVYFNIGTLTITAGSISDNTAGGYGGGIYQNGGTINQNGGTIADNNALVGGGIYQYGLYYNLNSGTISGNTATSFANGIYVDDSGQLTLAPTNGALTFGANDDIYLPNGVTFDINARLDQGVTGNVPLAFADPHINDIVAVCSSGIIAANSASKLVSGTIQFARDETTNNIIITSLTKQI